MAKILCLSLLLVTFSCKNEKTENKFIIEANSSYNKIILSKNSAGKITNYQLEAKVVLEEWLKKFSNWEVLPSSEIFFDLEDYKFIPSRFHRLDLQITS